VLASRAGVALLAAFVASIVVAQVQAIPSQPSVVELLVKWTPLLAKGFLFNLLISFFAMLVGTLAGIAGMMHVTRVGLANPYELVGGELDVIAAVVLGGACALASAAVLRDVPAAV